MKLMKINMVFINTFLLIWTNVFKIKPIYIYIGLLDSERVTLEIKLMFFFFS